MKPWWNFINSYHLLVKLNKHLVYYQKHLFSSESNAKYSHLKSGKILAEQETLVMGTLCPESRPDTPRQFRWDFFQLFGFATFAMQMCSSFSDFTFWRASILYIWQGQASLKPLIAHLGCCLLGECIHLGWTFYHISSRVRKISFI